MKNSKAKKKTNSEELNKTKKYKKPGTIDYLQIL